MVIIWLVPLPDHETRTEWVIYQKALFFWTFDSCLLCCSLFCLLWQKLTVSSSVTDLNSVPVDSVSTSDLTLVCWWLTGRLLVGGFIWSTISGGATFNNQQERWSERPSLFTSVCSVSLLWWESHQFFFSNGNFQYKKTLKLDLFFSVEVFKCLNQNFLKFVNVDHVRPSLVLTLWQLANATWRLSCL